MSQIAAFIEKLAQHVNMTSEIENLINDFVCELKEEKPKKSLNAYILFCRDQRATVKSENPEMDSKEITSELASRWVKEKEADSEVFKKYKQMQGTESDEKKEKKEKVKKEKKENEDKPKKPLNAYILFCRDQRATVKSENPEMDSKQITSELASRWGKEKQADSQVFKKYTELSEKERLQYAENADAQKNDAEEVEKKSEEVQKKGKKTKKSEEVQKENEEVEKKSEEVQKKGKKTKKSEVQKENEEVEKKGKKSEEVEKKGKKSEVEKKGKKEKK